MMDQANIDYLFQVTAALTERTSPSAQSRNAPPFDVHFAQASEPTGGSISSDSTTARRAFDRPQERPAYEPEPSGLYASNTDTGSAEYGSCDETQSASCPDPDPDSDDDADTAQPETGSIDSSASQAESSEEESSSESNENIAVEASALETSLRNDLIDPHPKIQSPTNTAVIESELAATDSTGERSEQGDAATQGSEGNKSTAARTEPFAPGAVVGEFTHKTATHDIEPGSQAIAVAPSSATTDVTSPVNELEGSKDRDSSASSADGPRQFVVPRGLATAGDVGPSTGANANAAEKAPASRRINVKREQSDDPGRRATEANDLRSVQRSDSAGPANQLVGAMLNANTSDTRSAQASNAGDESKVTLGKTGGSRSDLLPHTLARPQRGHAGGGRAARADGAAALPRVDAARFVGRVAKAIQTASERGGALHLRLSPPELGSLRLALTVDNGVMSATLEADSSAARQVLLDHLPALRDRLAEQNIRIERFDVDVRQEGSGGQADARASQHDGRGQQPREPSHAQRLRGSHSGEELLRESDAMQSRITNNGINILA
jgi:flagellar hook-length control protein FliK